MRSKKSIFLLFIALWVAACQPQTIPPDDGPQLVSESTLVPTDVIAVTRQLSPTPTVNPTEIPAPLQDVTVEAQFIVITPTLPPSKTPTPTLTFTPTPSQTPSPTTTNTATATTFLLPTSEIIPVTAPAVQAAPRVCDSTWFFIQPRPDNCPTNPPNASQAVYQEFERGYMLWVGSQDAIYVMFNDGSTPRWRAYRDFFEEGMPEISGDYLNAPSPSLWQPRRGFGLLWRNDVNIRNRVGWATQEWEQPFSVQVQISQDGTLFMNTPVSTIFSLFPNGNSWQILNGSTTTTNTTGGNAFPPPNGGNPPLGGFGN